jgi:urease accessory protein
MATGDSSNAGPLRVSATLGNIGDSEWSTELGAARIDELHLEAAEAQRSRFRKRTAGGMDIAIALERDIPLRDGDVLHWDEDARTAVIARIDLGEVLVIDLSTLLGLPPETLLSRCVAVGHAIGNQHWQAVVKAGQVYVPMAVAPEVMEAVLETHRTEGVSWWFARGADILPALAPDEARLLFAGDTAGHSHLPAGGPDGATS